MSDVEAPLPPVQVEEHDSHKLQVEMQWMQLTAQIHGDQASYDS